MRLPVARLLLLVCALFAVVPAAANAATPPKVTSVAPLKLKIGERLTIRGKGFLAGKNRNTVLFKATGARAVFVKAESATSTVLVVKVPTKLAPFLKAASGTRFQLRVLARRLSPAYTPTGKSPVVAAATSTAVGSSPANTPESKTPSAVAKLVPATSSATTPAPTPPAAAAADCDGDGTPDTVDADDDNDLLPDATEVAIGTEPCNRDTDGDGMQDGWEYQSSIDLNTRSCPSSADYPVPCAAAMPSPTKHRSYPNPLDSADGTSDYDGDGMVAIEEYQGWKHKIGQDPTYFALTGPKGMWYSAGKKASVDTSTASGCRGMAVPDPFNGNMHREEFKREDGSYPDLYEADGTTVKTEYEMYSLDRRNFDGCLDDGERDEDGDFLTNFDEAHGKLSGPDWWATAMDEPAFQMAYSGTNWLDADSDGDGTVDGLDDQDFDDFLNIEELYRGTPVRTKTNGYTGHETGLWVDPFNPCLPAFESRTCPTYMPLGNPGAWRPFFADMTEPLGPRWPLYRTPLYAPREQDPTWVDPTPADNTDNAFHMIQYPAEVWDAPASVPSQPLPPEHPLPRTDW
jgi:hypothetical protein